MSSNLEQSADQAPLKIDIVSDVMCPWCYIGKRRFEMARELVPHIPMDVSWRPFQLDATLPNEGIDRQVYMSNKFGSPEQAEEAYAHVREAGRAEGIPFAFERIEVSANTLNAHRLIRWAGSAGKQDEIVEALFRAYFVEGKHLGHADTLLEAAAEGEMDRAGVLQLLESDTDLAETARDVEQAHAMGITGVPAFVVGDKYLMAGAQEPSQLAELFEKCWAEQNAIEPIIEDIAD